MQFYKMTNLTDETKMTDGVPAHSGCTLCNYVHIFNACETSNLTSILTYLARYHHLETLHHHFKFGPFLRHA